MKKILFLIFAIVLIFAMVFLVNSVNAIVCCEKLKGSANYCVDKINGVDIQNVDKCDTSNGFKAYQGKNCARVDNCKVGCCSYDNDGSCFNDKIRVACEKNKGLWSADNCENVDICKEGCCFLNTNTFFSSEGECRIKAGKIGVSFSFDSESGFKDDSDCQEKLDEMLGIQVMGSCVSSEGCSYVNKESCNGDFRKDEYCMDVKSYGCEIGYKCVNGKKDVYKVSSCGDEKIQEECEIG